MLLLTTTTQVLRLITDAAATVDVHASWVDRNGSTDSPGSTNTAISTATTTTVVAAPAASTARNVRRLIVRNRSASVTVNVTTQIFDGSTAYQLDSRSLGPGASLIFDDTFGFIPTPSGGPLTRPWFGKMAGCLGDGDPGWLMNNVQSVGAVAATPTNITVSIARCCAFMLPFDLTFNRIRAYGVGATTSLYNVAIYRMSDLARLTAALSFSTAANTWVSIGSALNVTLSKDTSYFVAVSVVSTGTTAGVACMGPTIAATTGEVITTPAGLPGSLSLGATAFLDTYNFQFAVSTGVLPNPAATLAAQAAWTGGMPAFWLDSVDT